MHLNLRVLVPILALLLYVGAVLAVRMLAPLPAAIVAAASSFAIALVVSYLIRTEDYQKLSLPKRDLGLGFFGVLWVAIGRDTYVRIFPHSASRLYDQLPPKIIALSQLISASIIIFAIVRRICLDGRKKKM